MTMPYANMDKMTDSLIKAYSDMNLIFRDSMSAALQSATIFTKGCEEMCDTMSALIQRSLESNAQASRTIMASKNISEVMDMQSSLIKDGFDSAMIEMNRFMQMSSRLAQQVTEPVAQNMNATIVKLSKVKAA